MSRVKYENPFAMGNLDDLMYARENDDLEYLKEWSRKAVKKHEETKQAQLDLVLPAHKWEKLVDSLMQIVDKKDLVNLEFGRTPDKEVSINTSETWSKEKP